MDPSLALKSSCLHFLHAEIIDMYDYMGWIERNVCVCVCVGVFDGGKVCTHSIAFGGPRSTASVLIADAHVWRSEFYTVFSSITFHLNFVGSLASQFALQIPWLCLPKHWRF